MSSRSFRRRNNRRRHRQDAAGGGLPGAPGGQLPNAPDDGTPPGGGEVRGPREPDSSSPRPDSSRGDRQQGRQQGGGEKPHGRQPGGNQRGNLPRSRPQKGRAAEPQRPPQPAAPIVFPDCPVCGKQVRELASALTHRVARQPAHFECVMRELLDSNEMSPEEKICYLGGGSFGILEFRPPGGSTRFVIRKRIQYEEKETPQEWKKPLQVSC
jgi:hypothetical protein